MLLRTRLFVIACVAVVITTVAVVVPGGLRPSTQATGPVHPLLRAAGGADADTTAATTTTAPDNVVAPPTATTATTAEVVPMAHRVLIIGDSLTEAALPFIPGALQQVHWAASDIDAIHGRKTQTGIKSLIRHRAALPPTVLIALGTNDLAATPDQFDMWVKTARAIVGPNRRLVWVNLHLDERPDRPDFSNYHVVNAALASAAAKYHVELADWESWSVANHVTHVGDGIHYPPEGSNQRALFYAQVLAAHG